MKNWGSLLKEPKGLSGEETGQNGYSTAEEVDCRFRDHSIIDELTP